MHDLDRFSSMPKAHTGDDLRLMGLRASRKYLDKEASLTAAVAELASENDLNHFQIQRVCEFANNTTFKSLFEKQAGSKIVEFSVADARAVQAKTGGKPPKQAAATTMYKKEYVLGEESADFEALFGIDKTASVSTAGWMDEGANPENGKLKLSHTWQGLENELNGLKVQFSRKSRLTKEAAASFFGEARRLVGLEEATLGDIATVVLQRSHSPMFAKVAMQSLTKDLFDSGYLTKEAVGPEPDQERESDPESPVAQSFDNFQQLIMDVQTLAKAIAQITQIRDQAKAALTGGMLPSAQEAGPQTGARQEQAA